MQKHVSSVMMFLLAMSTLALALEIRPARADGTVYINADGSITPSSVPISTFDNVTYTFTGNINESMVVQRDNVAIDGAGCTVRGSGSGNGIDLESVNNVTIENTSITGFSSGIWLNSSSNNTLSDNSITGNGLYGIYLHVSSNETISGNTASGNSVGIYLYYSSNDTLSDNEVTGNYKGIVFDSSSNNTVSDNNVTGNGGGISLSDDSNNKVSGNTVTGNGGGIGLGPSSSNDTLSGNTVTGNTSWGITLGDSSNNTISGNNVTRNSYQGINLYSSFNNTVSSNSITENFGDAIYIFYCSNNTVSGNNVTRNSYGIWFDDSSNNAILGNIATGNSGSGIALGSSTYNRVSDNSAIGNGDGIFLDSSSNNTIYHNNFINNTQQAALSSSGPNVWDNGYPSGGNYWGGYAGVDEKSGPSQDQNGSDGIGDAPQVIDANNTDHYPLMAPITVFEAGTWNGTAYNINILSNSTVSNVQINIANKTVSFNVTGLESTPGFCRVTIPNIIIQNLWHGNYTVLLNSEQWPFTNWTDASNTYIYINYTHSEHEVVIVPEFPSTMTVWLFTLLSAVAVALANRRTPRKLKT